MTEEFPAAACEVSQWAPAPLAAEPPGTSQLFGCSSTSRPKAKQSHCPSEAPFTAQHPSAMACGVDGLLSLPNPPKWGCPLCSILRTQPLLPYRGENSLTARYNHAGPYING